MKRRIGVFGAQQAFYNLFADDCCSHVSEAKLHSCTPIELGIPGLMLLGQPSTSHLPIDVNTHECSVCMCACAGSWRVTRVCNALSD